MAYDIGPRIGVDGEKEFKSAISAIESQMKALNSEMKASVTSMEGMQSAEESAAKKSDILARSIEAGKQKIELIQSQYDKAKEKLAQLGDELENAKREFGENSEEALKAEQAYNRQAKATNDLAAKLNKAQADVNDMTRELDSMGKEADDAGEEMEDAGKKGKVFGDTMKGVVTGGLIVKGLEKMAEAAKKVAGALKDAIVEGAKYADDLVTLSAKTGIATDTLQEYQYMAELVDVSVETLTGSLKKLTKNMDSARGGSGAAATAFDRLGVSVVDANGELRDNEDVFADVIDALGKMTNETERDALAMDIFGKSAQDLNPLIKAGGETIKDLADEAHRMGYVLDEEGLNSLLAVSDAMERLHNLGQTVKNQLAVALAPVIEQVAEKITAIIEQIDWDRLAEVIGNIINFLLDNYKAVGVALAAIAAGFAAVSLAASPLTLVAVVIAAIAIETFKCKKALEELFGVDVPAWAAMVVSAVASGPIAVLDKLNGVFGDNKKTAEDWKDGTTTSLEAVAIASATASQGLVQNGLDIQAAFKAMGDKLRDVVDGMKTKFGELKNHVATVKDSIITGLTEAFDWISELPGKVLKIGGQIVEGLWKGISDKVAWLIGRIKSFCQQALDAIKSFFGIHSPSKVMRDQVGVMMMAGWQAGIKIGTGGVLKQLKQSGADMLKVADAVLAKAEEKENELEEALKADKLKKEQKEFLQSQLETINTFANNFADALVDIEKKESAMADRLSGYGSLIEKSTSSALGEFSGIRGLTNDIRVLGRYQTLFKLLADAGASKQFLADFAETDPEKAVEFAEALLKLSEAEQRQYFAAYDASKNVERQTEAMREQAVASATVLSSLEAENEALEEYGSLLAELDAKGAPDSLLSTVAQMDVDEARKYMKQLTSLTSYELDQYIGEWNKKQGLAARIAKDFYADEKDSVIKGFVEAIPEELGIMKDDLYQVGIDSAKGLAQGLLDAKDMVVAAAKSITEATRSAIENQEEIHSPSKKWAAIGGFMASGLAVGFVDKMRGAAAGMMRSIPQYSPSDIERVGAGVVNGMAAASSGGMGGLTITVPLYLDGREIARAQLQPLMDVARQEGVSFA